MGKQNTIRDVADLAGFSVATAPRVLNNTGYPIRALRQDSCSGIGSIVHTPLLLFP